MDQLFVDDVWEIDNDTWAGSYLIRVVRINDRIYMKYFYLDTQDVTSFDDADIIFSQRANRWTKKTMLDWSLAVMKGEYCAS